MARVKICGITNSHDALAAVSLGADALGFIFAESPRRVTAGQAAAITRELPPFVSTVGVFVNADLEEVREIRRRCSLDLVQLHGDEDESFITELGGRVIKGLRVGGESQPDFGRFQDATLLLDTWSPSAAGGTGHSFDWSLAVEAAAARPIILAGGLNPDNVKQAIETVKPYAVDVSSGVEKEYGRKDYGKLSRFIRCAKLSS